MHLHYQTGLGESRGPELLPARSAGGEDRAVLASPAFLGNTTISRNPPPSDFGANSASFRRIRRYAYQTAAREILNEKRLRVCCRALLPTRPEVEIHKTTTASGSSAFHYGGLMVCGSVWVCPVCASKITERRRLELSQGVESWKAQGGSVYLLTLTVPHYASTRLATVLDGLSDAFRRMMNRKHWRRFSDSVDLAGRVRTLEVTHGPNGWHPHFHVLLFSRRPVLVFEYERALLEHWQSACVAAGLPRPNRHGLSLDDGSRAAHYVSKWGLESEMTKGHVKEGVRDGHVSPFGLLGLHLDENAHAADLFREYARIFKGKRQLVWSDGLRDLLGLGKESTDEELATSEEENATLFVSVPLNVWKVILHRDQRGQLLDVCHQGLDAVYDFIIEVMGVHVPEEVGPDDVPF